jgi:hypothetical protein
MTAETNHPAPLPSAPALPELPNWLCLIILAAFPAAILGDVLFGPAREVLSQNRWDLHWYFINWRYFGFHELKSGHLALWNPHCAGGAPFFGNFQSALLYPLNFLFLLLPLAPAINWTIALHLFLGGVFMFYWARHRGLHSLACLLAAVMFMFCGPQFLQIQSGHLPNLATLIWAPLLLLAIDKLVDRPALAPCLLGMFALAMSVLAGHPQYVFYLGVAAGIYSMLNLLHAEQRGKVILGLAGMVAGGIALSAVQLFTGLQEGRESLRSLGLSYDFAAIYSFPPENFLTLVAPWFFGDVKTMPYWGRWYLTEVSLFVSVMGLVLAVFGMAFGRPAARRLSITLLIVVLLLALGGYTPLFHFLFNDVPGFDKFRGMDKFLWLAALFLSMLAAVGMDRMLRQERVPLGLVVGVAGAGFVLSILASFSGHLDWWAGMIKHIPEDNSSLLPAAYYLNPRFISLTSKAACESLMGGAITLFVAASILELARSRRNLACLAMLLLAGFELADFARTSLFTFKLSAPYPPNVLSLLAENPGDYRIKAFNPDSAMTAGAFDISGDDPSGLLRYNRFLDFAAGLGFDSVSLDFPTRKNYDTNVCRLLRCRYLFSDDESSHTEVKDVLPQLLLVGRFRVMTNFHEIFSTLTNADFNPRQEVILENPPDPLPQPAREKGTVKLLDSSTDSLTIEADTGAPALLLITDSYSSSWRALAQPGSAQARYEVMPADYCLRAIPLAAGHHLLRVEYSPLGFRIGKVVSLVALAAFVVLLLVVVKDWRRKPAKHKN